MVEVLKERGATVLVLGPEYNSLDDETIQRLTTCLLQAAQTADPPWIVLDLSHTTFFGSGFLEVLIRMWKRLRERDGRLALCCLHPYCAEVLHVARLDTLWQIGATRKDAIDGILAGD
jgi:anti-sigma B factor antagonist